MERCHEKMAITAKKYKPQPTNRRPNSFELHWINRLHTPRTSKTFPRKRLPETEHMLHLYWKIMRVEERQAYGSLQLPSIQRLRLFSSGLTTLGHTFPVRKIGAIPKHGIGSDICRITTALKCPKKKPTGNPKGQILPTPYSFRLKKSSWWTELLLSPLSIIEYNRDLHLAIVATQGIRE